MTCEASEEETFYGSTMGRRRGLVHISCELFLACVFVSSRDAPTLAITTTDLKPSGYPPVLLHCVHHGSTCSNDICLHTGYRAISSARANGRVRETMHADSKVYAPGIWPTKEINKLINAEIGQNDQKTVCTLLHLHPGYLS